MWGWLEGIFDWLMKQLRPLLEWIGGAVMRLKWFIVALIGAITAPINWILDWANDAWDYGLSQTVELLSLVQSAGMGSAKEYWAGLSAPAALMNCVVPLDYALALGSVLLTFCIGGALFKALIWLYSLIPFKAS